MLKVKVQKNCRYCSSIFYAADIKASYCGCFSYCECGNKKMHKSEHCSYCAKTIYRKSSCGYQKGDANIARRPDIRKKISYAIKKSYTPELRKLRSIQRSMLNRIGKIGVPKFLNSQGQRFRSTLEVQLSELLFKNNIPYDYEYYISLINGTQKMVDFKVGNTLIEISGFAYDRWQQDFIRKMRLLRQSTDAQIIVLTYPKYLKQIYAVTDYDIYTGSIYDHHDILQKIIFCQRLGEVQCLLAEK